MLANCGRAGPDDVTGRTDRGSGNVHCTVCIVTRKSGGSVSKNKRTAGNRSTPYISDQIK